MAFFNARAATSVEVGALDDFTFDDVFGQEADRPASAAGRRFGAMASCDELGLALAIEDGVSIGGVSRCLRVSTASKPFGHQRFAERERTIEMLVSSAWQISASAQP